MTPPDFLTARWFVSVSCLWIAIVGGVWVLRTGEPLAVRLIAGVAFGIVAFVLLPETLRYVSRRETSFNKRAQDAAQPKITSPAVAPLPSAVVPDIPPKPFIHPSHVHIPNVILTSEPDRLVLSNKGNRNFYLCGSRLGDEPASMSDPPVIVPKDGYYYLLTNLLKQWAVKTIGTNGQRLVPLDLYFMDEEKHKKSTGKFRLLIVVSDGSVAVHAQMLDVVPENWTESPPVTSRGGDISAHANISAGNDGGGSVKIEAGSGDCAPGGNVTLGPGDYRAGNGGPNGNGGDFVAKAGDSKCPRTK